MAAHLVGDGRHPNALVGRLVSREQRGTVYGITASAMFLANSLGPLSGGAVAAAFGLRGVFLVTAAVLLANLVWVYCGVPEYGEAGMGGNAD